MIEKCITDKTKIFEIKTNSLIEFNTTDVDKFNVIAKKISEETGVPQDLIYTAPYFFFINHWHKIDGEWFFYKSNGSNFHFINELLGEVITNFFGLDTIHYKIAKLNVEGNKGEYGLISKNFCEIGNTYKTVWDYGFAPRKDLCVLENIRNICQSEKEYLLLLEDLKKFFIRDFYVSQSDRTGNNFLFKITSDGIRLAPLYDYEYSFESIKPHIYRNQIAQVNITNSETQSLFRKDLKFQELLYLIMRADMQSFINEVEDKHKILVPSEYKELYKKHDTKIKRLVLENKLIK